jgi:hypothetical protein
VVGHSVISPWRCRQVRCKEVEQGGGSPDGSRCGWSVLALLILDSVARLRPGGAHADVMTARVGASM